jgi:uncharacterized protein with HEPN domain
MPSDKAYNALVAIRDNIALARSFVADMDLDTFAADWRSLYAVTRCLEIISEASRRLGPEMESRHPDVPWRQIAGAGNLYRHDYDNVSPAILWATVRNALGPLERAVVEEIVAADRRRA